MLSRIICKYTFAQAAGGAPVVSADAFKALRSYMKDYQPIRAQKGLGDNIDFQKDMKPALDHYKQLGFTRRELGKIFMQKISGLCLNNGSNDRIKQDIIQLSAFLKSEYKFSNEVIRRIVQNNHSLLSTTQEDIKHRFGALKQSLNLNDQQAIDIVVLYPQLFTSNMELKINKVKRVFNVWAGFTDEQSVNIIQTYPFIVDFNQEYIHDNLKLLITKGFSVENLYNLIINNPDCLIEKPAHLLHSFYLPKSLNLTQEETVKTFIENPDLITICPISMIPIKIKMLRNYRVLDNNLKTLWLEHTVLFTSSLGSLELKQKYLNQRAVTFGKPKNLISYFSLSYSGVIRPRCETAIRLAKKIDLDVDLQISEEQFLSKYSIPKEEFEKVKAERKEHVEKDFKKRFYHQVTQSI